MSEGYFTAEGSIFANRTGSSRAKIVGPSGGIVVRDAVKIGPAQIGPGQIGPSKIPTSQDCSI